MRMYMPAWMAALLLLTACSGGDDLQEYVARVKARPPAPIEPLPKVEPFVAMVYEPVTQRTPFASPQPELLLSLARTQSDCEVTLPLHDKEPLEQYALDNLGMRGTMGGDGKLWALIHTDTGEVHRVGIGQYLGLNQGRIIRIAADRIELLESVPDGKGCWTTRETQLNLDVAE